MIKEALNEFANSMNKIWTYDRSNTIGGSEIGGCARKAFYEKNRKIKTGVKFRANRTSRENIKRYEPDKDYVDGWGARMRGNLIEAHLWVPALKKRFGKNLLMAGKDQKSLFKGFLSATPDGLVINQKRDALASMGVPDIGPGCCFVVEGKSIDPRVPLAEAKSENVYHVQCQIGLIRECTKYKPEYALISYIDASFHDSVTEFVIQFNPHIYNRAKIRATEIKTAKSPTELKPEGWIAGGKECEYCAFLGPCGIARFNLPNSEKPVDDQFKAEIIDLCRSLNEVKQTKEWAETEIRSKQEDIKNRLREKGVRKIKGVITWSNVKGRESYDMVALRKAAEEIGLDITPFETVGQPSDRMTIADIEDKREVESAIKQYRR